MVFPYSLKVRGYGNRSAYSMFEEGKIRIDQRLVFSSLCGENKRRRGLFLAKYAFSILAFSLLRCFL